VKDPKIFETQNAKLLWKAACASLSPPPLFGTSFRQVDTFTIARLFFKSEGCSLIGERNSGSRQFKTAAKVRFWLLVCTKRTVGSSLRSFGLAQAADQPPKDRITSVAPANNETDLPSTNGITMTNEGNFEAVELHRTISIPDNAVLEAILSERGPFADEDEEAACKVRKIMTTLL